MNRRNFIKLMAGGAAAIPFVKLTLPEDNTDKTAIAIVEDDVIMSATEVRERQTEMINKMLKNIGEHNTILMTPDVKWFTLNA